MQKLILPLIILMALTLTLTACSSEKTITRLTNNDTRDEYPSWSPDGTKIAFASDKDITDELKALNVLVYQIYSMNADGSNQTRLTNGKTGKHPSWSPDGTKIVFQKMDYINEGWQIYVMNADGTNQTNISNNDSDDEEPSWSPDGTKIAFTSDRDGVRFVNQIYVMNADGTNQTRLTNSDTSNTGPSWSNDGSKIVFETMTEIGFKISTMNADGSNQTNIADTLGATEPSWSPDGKKIAFASHKSIDGTDEFSPVGHIYVMNPDGTNQTRLTKDALIENERRANYSPSWSNDGSKIVFQKYIDDNFEIYVMDY